VSDLPRKATLAVLMVVVALATATPVCADPTPVTAGKHAPAERHTKSSHPSKPTTHPKKSKAVAHSSTKPAVKGHASHPVETRSAKRPQAQVPRTGKSSHHETGQGHTAPVKAKRVTPKAHPEDERAFDPDDFNTRSGCAAPSREHDNLWSAIGIEDEGFRSLLVREASRILQSEQACVPYALLVDPDNHPLALALAVYDPHTDLTMLFLFNRDDQTHAMHFQSDSIPTHPRHTHVESFLLQDALSRPDGLQSSIPDSMLFELSGLATTLADAANRADAEDCLVRLVYDDGDSGSPTRLQSLELLDRRTGQNLGHALWLDRPDLPGGYFTPNGYSFERQFWTSPVTFTHISRGVGASTIRLRWVGHPKSKARKKHSIQHTRVRSENHIGVDFAAPKGTPVLSVADGRVVFSGPAGGYGNLVIIEHPGGYTTHYGHLNAFATTTYIGAEVHRGQEIGYVGTTGLSTGYHLHFEIRLNGAYLDPLDPSQPFALWTLRKSDYIPLVRQILLANLTLMASDTGLPTRGQ
jgi:murein DD-endopeptidase MepM/ murein hydrolase activator NlpD